MERHKPKPDLPASPPATAPADRTAPEPPSRPSAEEVGGRGGAEPTRYGDWEVNGICTDF